MSGPSYRDFLSWPLVAAAILCFVFGISLLEASTGESTDVAGAVLITIGTVLAGAWIFALGTGGHKGGRPPDPPLPPPSG